MNDSTHQLQHLTLNKGYGHPAITKVYPDFFHYHIF